MGITAAGKAAFADLCGDVNSIAAFTYLELGSSDTAFVDTQTALVTAITGSGLARAAATVTRATTTDTNDTLQLAKTWTASGSATVREIGVFNASSSGTMAARSTLTTARSLTSGNTYTGTYQIVFA
jgi:hypothetical protein